MIFFLAIFATSSLDSVIPAFHILYNWFPTRPRDYPDYFFVSFIDFLMKRIAWYQGEIARLEIDSLTSLWTEDD